MKKELDDLLCRKYPEIFRDRHGDMRTTCMCFGFEVGDGWFNIIDVLCQSIQNHIDSREEEIKRATRHNKMVEAARAGDLSLFEKHYGDVGGDWKRQYLDKILTPGAEEGKPWGPGIRPIPESVPQVVAVQVKEKFAALRFYTNGGDDEIWGMVGLAEALSTRTCEQCGAPGKVVGKGWIKTLCPSHYRDGDAGTEREIQWKLVKDADE